MKYIKSIIHWSLFALNFIVSFFPFGLSVFLSLIYLHGGWSRFIDDHTLSFYFLPEINFTFRHVLAFGLYFLLVFILQNMVSMIKKTGHRRHRHILIVVTQRNRINTRNIHCILVMIIAWLIRYVILFGFKNQIQPFSDFNRIWDMANGKTANHLAYYTLFPTYLNFSLIERFFVDSLSFTYSDCLILNCVLSAFVAGLIYLISYEVSNNDKLSLTASLLYGFTPASIFYCYFGAPEQIVLLFNTAGLFFFLKALNQKTIIRIILSIIGGILVGVGSAYKAFGIVILLAYLIILVLKSFNIETGQHLIWVKRFGIAFLCFALAFTGYKISSDAILSHTEREYHVELDYSNSIPHFLLVGLNTESEGQIHLGTLSRQYYQRYLANGNDIEDAKSFAFQLLKDDLENNRNEIGRNLRRKLIWSWQDDSMPLMAFLNNEGLRETETSNTVFSFIEKYGAGIFELFYLFLMFFGMIGSIGLIQNKTVDFGMEFFLVIILGFFFMILLSESQSRYKSLVMPYICILSASGVYNMGDIISYTRKNSKK